MTEDLEMEATTEDSAYSCRTWSAVPRLSSRSRTIPLRLSKEDCRKGNMALCRLSRSLSLKLRGAAFSRHFPRKFCSLAVPSLQEITHCSTSAAIAEEDEILGKICSRAERLLRNLSIFPLASLMLWSWVSHEL